MQIPSTLEGVHKAYTAAQTAKAKALAAYTAHPSTRTAAALARATELFNAAEAAWLSGLDRLDVAPVRGVLETELRGYLGTFAPALANAGAQAIRDQIEAELDAARLPAGAEPAAVARLAIVYGTVADAYALVSSARSSAGLPAPAPLGSGSAPTNTTQAASELAAVLAAAL